MSNEPSTRKSVTLPDSLWADIAEFRFSHRISTEVEAVRLLLRAGLGVRPEVQRKRRVARNQARRKTDEQA